MEGEPCLGDRREEKAFVTVCWVGNLLRDVGAFVSVGKMRATVSEHQVGLVS